MGNPRCKPEIPAGIQGAVRPLDWLSLEDGPHVLMYAHLDVVQLTKGTLHVQILGGKVGEKGGGGGDKGRRNIFKLI